jgi:Calcineurin-like phosphoesterase
LLLTILLFSFFLILTSHQVFGAGPSFRFAAAGDHSQDVNTNSSLRRLASSGVDFYLALGDLSYQRVGEEDEWCSIVESYVGQSFPFEIVSGFHDDGRETAPNDGGLIDNFVDCLPDKMGSSGIYGKEYYFDYPPSSPLARIIMISPDLNFTNGGYYSYTMGSSHYEWLSGVIDRARASGILWVIVAMHKPCISAGIYSTCIVGGDLMNLLIQKKVDLVLQAHDHNYQRSKQLTCAVVEHFSSGCVVDDGSSGTYSKGRGAIFVIAGTFGQEFYPINYTSPNAPYFASLASNNTRGMAHGFVSFTVSAYELTAQTYFSGTFSDSFRIVEPGALQALLHFVEDNSLFVSLLIAPIVAGTILVSIKWWKRSLYSRKSGRVVSSMQGCHNIVAGILRNSRLFGRQLFSLALGEDS